MARTKTIEPKKSLKELIPAYGEIKLLFDKYKKQEGELNKEIKKLMAQEKLDSKSVDGWVVEYSIRTSDSYDEEALLEYMHKHKAFADAIKTKEYIDEDVLEQLIYNGKIPQKQIVDLDKYRIKKESQVLKIKKVEEK